MQVVDLRPGRRGEPPTVDLWASTGAELVRAAAALTQQGICDDFDVGQERLGELADRLDDGLRNRLRAQPEQLWLFLSSLAAMLEEPGTAEDLLTLLEQRPLDVWRALVEGPLGELTSDARRLLDGYAAGDVDAAALREELADEQVRPEVAASTDADKHGALLTALLAHPPHDVVAELHDVLVGVHETVGAEMLAEAIGPMQREVVARRQQLASGRHPGELVVEATNGYELSEDLPVDQVLLLPSYWFRPWLIINRVGSAEVLTSPVADEHLALPSAAPPPALVKLTKALGDEGRLRLLRRMGGGPITLADAMDELELAKTTAHHHLSILRQAGLVVIRGEGRDSRYALRAHAPTAAATALEEYLGSAVPLVEDDAADVG